MKKNTKKYYKLNDNIKSPKVRVSGEVIDLEYALQMAKDKNLDLIEIVPNSNPPVCRIIEFKKFLYEIKQKEKKMKKNQKMKSVKTKELRFRYNTGEHDFNFKLKHAIDFLKNGDRVKAYVRFIGREIQYIDNGKLLLLNFVDKLKDYGKIEHMPVLNNKRLTVIVVPK